MRSKGTLSLLVPLKWYRYGSMKQVRKEKDQADMADFSGRAMAIYLALGPVPSYTDNLICIHDKEDPLRVTDSHRYTDEIPYPDSTVTFHSILTPVLIALRVRAR